MVRRVLLTGGIFLGALVLFTLAEVLKREVSHPIGAIAKLVIAVIGLGGIVLVWRNAQPSEAVLDDAERRWWATMRELDAIARNPDAPSTRTSELLKELHGIERILGTDQVSALHRSRESALQDTGI